MQRRERLPARLAAAARATKFRSFSSPIEAASSAPRASSSPDGSGPVAADAWSTVVSGSGNGPGAKRSLGGVSAPSFPRIVASSCVSSKAHADELVFTCSVPSRATRAGQAFRAICSPTAAGHASAMRPISVCAPKRESSPRTASASRSRFHLHELRRVDGKRRAVRSGHDRLSRIADEPAQHRSARRV